jgi:Predicted membrane protein
MGKSESSGFLRLSVLLALACTGCVLLFGVRVAISGKTSYSSLVWNLFLAFVPYVFAAVGVQLMSRARSGWLRHSIAILTSLLWLVFYPNAPYIFTDFIHVINKTYLRTAPSEWLNLNALLWYDVLMNAAFAFLGHFIGLASMWLMQGGLGRLWGERAARVVVGAAILFSGFGIYLGRFSRLNSWDMIFDLRRVASEVSEALSDPKAILFSAVFSLFILLTYIALIVFKKIELPAFDERKD